MHCDKKKGATTKKNHRRNSICMSYLWVHVLPGGRLSQNEWHCVLWHWTPSHPNLPTFEYAIIYQFNKNVMLKCEDIYGINATKLKTD